MKRSHHTTQGPRGCEHPDAHHDGVRSGVRRAVLVCEGEDDLSPDVVGLLERAWGRGLCLEVAIVFDDGTLRMLERRYPGAVFVRVRTAATNASARTTGRPEILEVSSHELQLPDTVVEAIEAALAAAHASDEAELPVPSRPSRRLLWTDAITLADRLQKAPRAKPSPAE